MNWIQIINGVVVLIGIPTIAGVLISIGGKLKTLEDLETDVKNNIKPDLKEIREKFFALEGRYAGAYQQNSPISLTLKGKEILGKSGLKKFIDDNKTQLMDHCHKLTAMTTAYDVQSAAYTLFDNYTFEAEFESRLKIAAYDDGISLDVVKRVGAIYFRDICLKELNLDATELDKDIK